MNDNQALVVYAKVPVAIFSNYCAAAEWIEDHEIYSLSDDDTKIHSPIPYHPHPSELEVVNCD